MMRHAHFACLFAVAACATPPLFSDGQDLAAKGSGATKKGKSTAANGTHGEADDPDQDPGGGARSGPTAVFSESFRPIDESALDPFFAEQMQLANVPGVSVAVVRGGELKWAKGYGLANIASKKNVTKNTIFMLASISKTVTGVALMQLIEDPTNRVSLDDDVAIRLPFRVRNPSFPSTPITYRMLLTHTSTLIDSDHYWAEGSVQPRPQGDHATPLLTFERDYVARNDSWSSAQPGTSYEYSNTGSALAGLLVEQISGKNLQEYCRERIFAPLGMNESSFFLRDLDPSHIATPYEGTNLTDEGFYGYPDYPDGQLRTSAPQLSRFLRMFAQNGELDGKRLLRLETVAEMRMAQIPSLEAGQGLVWSMGGNGVDMGHTGSDDGVSTEFWFNTENGTGYVLLTNGRHTASDAVIDDAYAAMGNKLMELAETLP